MDKTCLMCEGLYGNSLIQKEDDVCAICGLVEYEDYNHCLIVERKERWIKKKLVWSAKGNLEGLVLIKRMMFVVFVALALITMSEILV